MRISDWSSDVCSSDLFVLSAGTRHNPTVIVSIESHRARDLVAGACRPARLPAVPARVAGGTGGARARGRASVAARAVLPAGLPGRRVAGARSGERRVGNEGVSTFISSRFLVK